MSIKAISRLTFKHHLIVGIVGCIWLTSFLVFVGPYDTATLTIQWRAKVMLVYGLVFLFVYMSSIPFQNFLYKQNNLAPPFKEILIYIFIFFPNLLGCYVYYISKTINGTYSFSEFTLKIFLPTIVIFYPLIAATRWAVANWRLPKWLAVTEDKEEVEHLKVKIQKLVDDKVYLQNDLTLGTMAKKLGTNTALLSKAINVGYDCNFNDFINGHRIEAVITAFEKGQHKTHTLSGIALECGFNSKATFYRAFKKHLHISPSTYLQKHLAD